MVEVVCVYCKKTFIAQRRSAKFCKPSHRTQYNRLATDVHNWSVAALEAMRRLSELQSEFPHLQGKVHTAMHSIKEREQRYRGDAIVNKRG